MPDLPKQAANATNGLEQAINKLGYNVLGKIVSKAVVKAAKADPSGEFYIYDLHDANGKLLALNRYVFVNNDAERPFAKLSKADKDKLNSPVVEPKPEPEA